MEHPQLVSNTLLVLPIHSLASYAHLAPLIDYATHHTSSRLLILLASPLFHPQTGIHPSTHWSDLQRLLSYIYSKVSATALRHDRVLLRIDVLVHGGNDAPISGIIDSGVDSVQWDACYVAYELNENLIPAWIRAHAKSRVPHDLLVPTHAVPGNANEITITTTTTEPGRSKRPRYDVAAIGGTFDHLHAGHKILLSMAAWITEEKLIVGVTDDPLLVKKAYREVLESIDIRAAAVREFLELFKRAVKYDIVPITDVYGPTASDPNIQVLIVSRETISGANAIALVRAEKSLPALITFVIDVISGNADAWEELVGENDAEKLKVAKMGSTYIRQWIMESQGQAGASRQL